MGNLRLRGRILTSTCILPVSYSACLFFCVCSARGRAFLPDAFVLDFGGTFARLTRFKAGIFFVAGGGVESRNKKVKESQNFSEKMPRNY